MNNKGERSESKARKIGLLLLLFVVFKVLPDLHVFGNLKVDGKITTGLDNIKPH